MPSFEIPNQYPIGTEFYPLGRKHAKLETVVDIHTTTNLVGDVVRVEYITEHEFCGGVVRGKYVKTSISRALHYSSTNPQN